MEKLKVFSKEFQWTKFIAVERFVLYDVLYIYITTSVREKYVRNAFIVGDAYRFHVRDEFEDNNVYHVVRHEHEKDRHH